MEFRYSGIKELRIKGFGDKRFWRYVVLGFGGIKNLGILIKGFYNISILE